MNKYVTNRINKVRSTHLLIINLEKLRRLIRITR
jgi:hypothetical protein